MPKAATRIEERVLDVGDAISSSSERNLFYVD